MTYDDSFLKSVLQRTRVIAVVGVFGCIAVFIVSIVLAFATWDSQLDGC